MYFSKIYITFQELSDLYKSKLSKEDKERFKNYDFVPLFFNFLDKLKVDSSYYEDCINDSKVFIIKIIIGDKEIYEMRG